MNWIPRSLHSRLLLSLGLGWLVLIAATLIFAYQAGSRLIEQANTTHLEYEAALIAQNVERSVQLRIDALERLAPRLTAGHGDPTATLRKNEPLLTLFDRLVVVSAEGRVEARWPYLLGLKGLQLADREYFKFVRAFRRPHVSEPFVGAVSGVPLVFISVPLEDAQGRFAGLLGGVVRVEIGGFFDGLRRIRIGEGGFAALITASGRVLSHPDPDWVMREVPDAKTRPNLDLALSGWEGAGAGRLADGRPALHAYRQVWPAGWVVGVYLPMSQVQAPIGLLVRKLWWVGVSTVLLMLPLLWWLLRLVLHPVHRLERHIARIGRGEATRVTLRTRMTELRQLADTFNRLERQRQEATTSLQDRQAFLDAVLHSSPIGMFVAMADGSLEYINPALAQLTGYRLEDHRDSAWTQRIHPEDRHDALELWREAMLSGRDFLRQFRYYHANGDLLWLEVHASLVADGDQLLGYVGTVKDITRRRELEALQRWEAEHDPLTGLLNRRGLERRLEEALAEWHKVGETSVLALFDLDHFKPINDEGGHALGDEMLREIAARVAPLVRRSDYVARYGGDEFAVLMPSCSLAQAEQLANKLLRTVDDIRVTMGGKQYRVTLSLGVTAFAPGDRHIEDVMARADAASYRAKEQGRNRMVVQE